MKRGMLVIGCLLVLAFALSAEAVQDAEVEQAPLTWKQAAMADGQALYAELCAVCHGLDGKGKGPAAEAFTVAMPDLTGLAQANGGKFPTAEVQKAITGEIGTPAHGSLEMPVWGRAFEDVRPDYKPGRRWGLAQLRILALTEYLESLQVDAE